MPIIKHDVQKKAMCGITSSTLLFQTILITKNLFLFLSEKQANHLPLLTVQYASSRRPCYIIVILSTNLLLPFVRLTYCPEFLLTIITFL